MTADMTSTAAILMVLNTAIACRGGISEADVARTTGLEREVITPIMSQLEACGLLNVIGEGDEPSPSPAVRRHYFLTDAGKDHARQLSARFWRI